MQENSLESSLKVYFQYLYIEYPEQVSIKINGSNVDTKNPYSLMKKNCSDYFLDGMKTDKFAIQMMKEFQLCKNPEQSSNFRAFKLCLDQKQEISLRCID